MLTAAVACGGAGCECVRACVRASPIVLRNAHGDVCLSLVLTGSGGAGAGYQHPPTVAESQRRDAREGGGTVERSWR
jgi:hypothetical protein